MGDYGTSGALRVVEGGRSATSAPRAGDADTAAGLREALERRSDQLKQGALSASTRQAYARDWKHFTAWCAGQGLSALPAEPRTVDLYLAAHAETLRPSTLSRRLVAISRAHRDDGRPSPTTAAAVRATFAGICREKGTAPTQKAPVLTGHLRAMVTARDDGTLRGLRDRALLLLGWAAALRASELAALTAGDVIETGAGLILVIRRSKTDQAGQGQRIGVPFGEAEETCPVRVLRAWRAAAKVGARGPLFREVDRHRRVAALPLRRQSVARIVKAAALAAGLDPALYSAHSLRAGLATSAAIGGADNRAIKKVTRHKSDRMVDRYVRDAELFRDMAAKKAGL